MNFCSSLKSFEREKKNDQSVFQLIIVQLYSTIGIEFENFCNRFIIGIGKKIVQIVLGEILCRNTK